MATPAQTSRQAQDADERALRKVFLKLVERMKATDVIDELYVCNLLMREEYEGILDACSKEDSKTLNRRVLMAISRRPPGFAAKLAEIFRKKHSYLSDALEEALAEVNCQPRADPAPTPDPSKDVHPSSSGSGVTSGPMSKWNVDALVALKGKLKVKVKMIALASILEIPAGGFMSSAEAQSVRDKTGDAQQIEQVIDILQGKGDKEFTTFCQMLQKSNYQVWAHELEVKAEKFKTSDALPGTDPAPLRGNPQAVMSTSASTPGPSKEGGVPPQQSASSTTHPFLPTLNNICWPEFPALQDEFSTLVSELSDTLRALEEPQFERLLVYLRERLRPMVAGCFPTVGSPNIPDDPTPSELVRHLQKCHYWNYLNTDLLEGIIRHVSREGSPLASLMAKYKENFCSKVTQTLEECKRKNVKPEPPPNYTTIAVEINTGRSPLSFHLYQIFQVKDSLVQTFGVNDILFAGFTEGSIVLYFFIPEEAVYSLCPKLEANCTALEELHVTTLVVFGHFSVDVGYQQMSLLHKRWSSQVSSLEEEVARLKQQLKDSEVDREELSAELRECRKIKVEPGVYTTKSVLPKKHRLKEEGEEEEPDHKRVKTEMAETVEVKLESHPQEEKEREERLYEPTTPSIIYEHDPQIPSMFPSLSPYSSTEQTKMAETVEMELESHTQEEKEGDGGSYEPPPPSIMSERGPQTPSMFPPPSPYTSSEHSLELAAPTFLHPESLEMGPPREEQAWVGAFPPHVFSGARPPVPQPSSFQQPVQMGPPGSQTTQVPPQVSVFPPQLFSGTRPPVPQPYSFQQPVLMGPPGSQRTQVGVFPPHGSSGARPPVPQPFPLLQPVGVFPPRVSSGARPPVTQRSSLQPVVPQVPPQVGVSSPYVFRGAIPPYPQLSSIAQPVQTTPLGSQQTQVDAFLPHVSSGALPPVHQVSSLLQPYVSPQIGVSPAHVFKGTSQLYRQPSSVAQPLQTTPFASQQTQAPKYPPLVLAAGLGQLATVQQLIRDGEATLEDCNESGENALHWAAAGGKLDIIKFLSHRFGAKVHDKDGDGWTILHWAAKKGHRDVARYVIVDLKLNPQDRAKYGDTALLLAALGGSVEMARMLLDEFGSTVDEVNNGGQNALHRAAAGGNLDIIKFLSPRFGARVHDKDGNDGTILHWAALMGHCDVARYVIEDLKLNPQDRDKDGDTALLSAAYGGSVEMARMLLDEFGSTVDEVDNDGYNALHVAATLGKLEVVKYLLPIFGVKRFSITRTGETCLSLARRRGHQEVVRYLLEEGGFKSK